LYMVLTPIQSKVVFLLLLLLLKINLNSKIQTDNADGINFIGVVCLGCISTYKFISDLMMSDVNEFKHQVLF